MKCRARNRMNGVNRLKNGNSPGRTRRHIAVSTGCLVVMMTDNQNSPSTHQSGRNSSNPGNGFCLCLPCRKSCAFLKPSNMTTEYLSIVFDNARAQSTAMLNGLAGDLFFCHFPIIYDYRPIWCFNLFIAKHHTSTYSFLSSKARVSVKLKPPENRVNA